MPERCPWETRQKPLLARCGLSICVEGRPNLRDQFFTSVRLRYEPAKSLVEHGADLLLLSKSAAEHDVDIWIDGPQLIKHPITVHDRQEKIEDHQTNLIANALIGF